jgi:hypothetical protein
LQKDWKAINSVGVIAQSLFFNLSVKILTGRNLLLAGIHRLATLAITFLLTEGYSVANGETCV